MSAQSLVVNAGTQVTAGIAFPGDTLTLHVQNVKGGVTVTYSSGVQSLQNPGSPAPTLVLSGTPGQAYLTWTLASGGSGWARVVLPGAAAIYKQFPSAPSSPAPSPLPIVQGPAFPIPQAPAPSPAPVPAPNSGMPLPQSPVNSPMPIPPSPPNASAPAPSAPSASTGLSTATTVGLVLAGLAAAGAITYAIVQSRKTAPATARRVVQAMPR